MRTKAPPLLPIFRSSTQLHLLGYLFLYVPEPLSVKDLEGRLEIPYSTLQREVERLDQAGLLRSSYVGRTRLVEADRDSPYHEPLRDLLLVALGPKVVLEERLGELEGVGKAYLYGSWARRYLGEPGDPPQDVDVLVVGDPQPEAVYRVCADLEREIGLPVNPSIMSPAEWEEATSSYLRNVRERPLVRLELRP